MLSTPQSKPFSRSLHDENDGPAQDAVWRFLFSTWGLDVEEGDTYGVDLVCYRGKEKTGYVEVERRHNWKERFPFDTLHIPYRKKKFFDLDKPTVLFAVKADLTEAFWVDNNTILQCPVERKDNKYMKGEYFFCVPIESCAKVIL
jgi:hypothetical protein